MTVLLSPVGGAAAQFFDNNGTPLTGGKLYSYVAGTTTPQATYTSASGATAHTNPVILDSGGRVPGGEIWLTDGLQYKFVLRTSTDVLIGTYDNLVGVNSNFVNFLTDTEVQTATAGQTVFTLTTMQYQPGTNNLSVFVDGVNQIDGATYSYVETSSTVVTFTAGLHVGALVKFTTAQTLSTGVTDASLVTYSPPFTGGVETTVENRLAQTVSVKDFGAVGDGVADDTAAIQAAVDQLPYGQALYFPTGTYKITDEITIPAELSFSFYGDGSRASTVQQVTVGKSGFVSANNPPTTAVNWCQIRDMGITGHNGFGWGFDMNGMSRANYINVLFESWGYTSKTGGCVRLRASIIVVFTNCVFNASNYGIYNEETLVTAWNGGGCFGCCFEVLFAPAVEGNYLNGLSFVGNTIESCYSGGVRVNIGGGGLIFHGNYFEENTTSGGAGTYFDIYLGSASYIKGVDIRGNYFNGKVTGATEDYVPIRVKYAYGLTIDANELTASPTGQLLKFDTGANVSEVYLGSIGFNLGSYSAANTFANLPTNFYLTGNNVNIFNQIVNVQPTSVRAVTVPVSLNVFTTAVAGTGAVTGQGIGTVLSTGATASSTALASTEGMALSIAQGQANLDWTKSFIADFYISNINSGTTNGNTWILLSKVAAVGNPTDNAAGFRIDGNALKGFVCNSFGTPVVVDLATTITNGTIALLRLESSNGQNWSFYVNGVLKGSAVIGVLGQVPVYLSLAVANNADAALQRVGIFGCDIRVNQ